MVPTHWPPWQLSPDVQMLLSLHGVLSGCATSAGQAAVLPSHVSATSQAPAAERQTVPLATNAFAGHVLLEPSHVSAVSHTPAADRQTVVLFASAGQSAVDPEQLSARSQAPADDRHTVEAGWKVSGGHDGFVPSQFSA